MKRQSNSMVAFALHGIGIGIPITLVCMTLIGGFNPAVKEFLIWTVASALFGILSGLIYNRHNELKLPLATVLHFAACLMVATLAGRLCGYSESFGELFIAILPVFIVAYIAAYAFSIFVMKAEEKRINKALSEK